MLNTDKIAGKLETIPFVGLAEVSLALARLQGATMHEELLNTMALNEVDE